MKRHTLKTVTVTFQYVMCVDTDYKEEYSTAVREMQRAFNDLGDHQVEIDIEDYADGDADYNDKCTPYGYFEHKEVNKTIGELK